MAKKATKDEREERAREICARLMALRPVREGKELSNNAWTDLAGVNSSVFTHMQKGRMPGLDILGPLLEVAGSSIPEFFLEEAQGRLVPKPSERVLKETIAGALERLPRNPELRAGWIALAVEDALLSLQDTSATQRGEDPPEEARFAEVAPAPSPKTKSVRAGSGKTR